MADSQTVIRRLVAWQGNWSNFRPEDVEVLCRIVERRQLEQSSPAAVKEFERDFAVFCGVSFGVAFCNGTMAIHTALRAVGVRAGDEVLIADYGFHGMAAAILALGAHVVPCDVDPQSLCLAAEDILAASGPRTKAVLVHNPWGLPADYAAIRAAAESKDLAVIADASHAHGASYRGRPIATWADITCFSLGLQKLISGGELGFAGTASARLRDRLFVLSQINRVRDNLISESFSGNGVGLKGRAHPLAACLASRQIPRYPEKFSKLRVTCQDLERRFDQLGFAPQGAPWPVDRAYWRLVLRIDPNKWPDRRKIESAFRNAGIPIEPNPYNPSLQQQPIFDWPDYTGQIRRRPCPHLACVLPHLLTIPAPVELSPSLVDEIFADLANNLCDPQASARV